MSTDKSFLTKRVISADGPKADELTHEASLVEWCATCIEPEEESNRRRSVLERIHNIVRVWIHQTMVSEFRMPEAAAGQVEGRIFATGSYRYNVHTSGSDIDMVLIAPSRITREHFFKILAARFAQEPWVKDLHCISDSRVPIIAMKCDGIDIDLSFGTIRQDRVPEIITDDLLQGLDEQSILSCNAVRVAHSIMDLVPNKGVFRQTLRFVKAWGKSRAIYSNTFGFPSGIGWAILVAFVCQCYPNQNAAGMVKRFFKTYHAWFKPNPRETGVNNRAIYLTESMRGATQLGHSWNPQKPSDASALFPVLTPALPYGNACYNVTLTNLHQLCDEFKRGFDIMNSSLPLSAAEARAKYGPYGVWSKLLEKRPFIGHFPHYLHLQVSCAEAAEYQAYVDGVESRMRILWSGTAMSRGQNMEDHKHLRLHLNPRRYEDPLEVKRRALVPREPAARGSYQQDSPRRLSTASAGKDGGVTWHTAHYILGLTVDASQSRKIDLSGPIRVFHNDIKSKLKMLREGVTRLPIVRVCDTKHIPQFIKDAEGYTDAPADGATAEGPEGPRADGRESTTTAATSGEDGERGGHVVAPRRPVHVHARGGERWAGGHRRVVARHGGGGRGGRPPGEPQARTRGAGGSGGGGK
ncbi:poly(A) polymerase [Strigomonas culicis]|uniref:Poly(A) polymerase n=1 Tax=Strigomonas culicis TaxID=28005 RepID=S9V801_9TRYP|nr:poly(A) polymerase [Strigomonas culicis]|eukprot:EPY37179.1 poly(A) polymerase [Strigomonas culicis]